MAVVLGLSFGSMQISRQRTFRTLGSLEFSMSPLSVVMESYVLGWVSINFDEHRSKMEHPVRLACEGVGESSFRMCKPAYIVI